MNKLNKSIIGLTIIMAFGTTNAVYGQQDSLAVGRTFTLGEVVVRASKPETKANRVEAEQITSFAKTDVAETLNLLSGVNLSAVGARNEAMVYVRGFDLRQVPLLIDGVPVYVPYDGYVDLARFTTFDLAAVEVSKGYTSVNYGPNALGGAINLISRRPIKRFELDGATGWVSRGYRSNFNVGSDFGKFYVQAGISKLNRNAFPLSNSFTPTATEDGGNRVNSYNNDEKYHVKVAYSPDQRSTYALAYTFQHGEKGSPVYAGSDPQNSQLNSPRYWQWPYWNKQSVYFISNTAIGQRQHVKTRVYYDAFTNLLTSYDDNTYTTITKGYAFKSYYDDYTLGGIGEYSSQLTDWYGVVGSVHYKHDVHREHNEGEPVRTMIDGTYTVALENNLRISSRWSAQAGFSFNNRTSIRAEDALEADNRFTDFPANNNNAYNVQGALHYRPFLNHALQFSVARKTRFATTKDRYSYRMGTALPNPHLNAEYAINYELAYAGRANDRLDFHVSAFYSDVNNTILMVSNVAQDAANDRWLNQLQNAGNSRYKGIELGANYHFVPGATLGGNYTLIERKNVSNPDLFFTDVPRHKVFGFLQYRLSDRISAQVNAEYNSERYSTSYGTLTPAFTLLNTRVAVQVWRWFSVESGINNIADRNYFLAEGYPEPGRNYFVNLRYRI